MFVFTPMELVMVTVIFAVVAIAVAVSCAHFLGGE